MKKQEPVERLLLLFVVWSNPLPHGVTPQQSSTMLQAAEQKYKNPLQNSKNMKMEYCLQFELLNTLS
jgi:hypothetical protein